MSDTNQSRRVINFLKGYPNPSYLPAKAIADAAQKALAKQDVATSALLYGADEGYPPLREAIAEWNTDFYRNKRSSDNIVISGGASQNLACILQVLTDPLYTQYVWISSPAYMLVFRIFQDHGFANKLRAVPEAADGIDIDWLAEQLHQAERDRDPRTADQKIKPERPESKFYRHLIYIVPTFSNPSSTVLPLAKREALIRLAREHDALLVADDVYDHLQWPSAEGAPPSSSPSGSLLPRLVDVDATLDGGPVTSFGNALSNGSFSKITGPGARCGWTDATPATVFAISQAGSTKSGGAPSQLTSAYMVELLRSGWLQEHIDQELRVEYAARWRNMAAAVERELVPLGCTLEKPGKVMGGFFLWLRLPDGVGGDELSERCREKYDLIIISGTQFEVPCEKPIRHNDHIRLCFTWEEKNALVEGVERLAEALRALISQR